MSVHAGERRLHMFTTLFPGGLPRMTDHDPPPPGAGKTPTGGPPPPGWPPPGDAPEYRVGHGTAPGATGAAGGPALAGGPGRQPSRPFG